MKASPWRVRNNRVNGAERRPLVFYLSLLIASLSRAEPPPGFFLEDLRRKPPSPAFYNVESHRIEPFSLKGTYQHFIDFAWDRERGTVFFSARRSARDPFRVYRKSWPDGEESPVYENPLGPFRFLLSPDGERMVVQVMGPAAWPLLALHECATSKTILLGEGFSPDWSADGRRLLFLRIPGALPTRLAEYRVDAGTSTLLMEEPVMEAVYTDDPEQIILKTAVQSKRCDEFQVWNRRTGAWKVFSGSGGSGRGKRCAAQREIAAFPGHRFFFFKERRPASGDAGQTLVIADLWGGRLQALSEEEWRPGASAVDPTTLIVGEDPLYVMRADGTGGRREIPQAGVIRMKK